MSCIYITFQAIFSHQIMTDLLHIKNVCLIFCPRRCGDHGAPAPVPGEGGGEHQGVRGAGGARQDGQDPGATGASVSRALCEHYPF